MEYAERTSNVPYVLFKHEREVKTTSPADTTQNPGFGEVVRTVSDTQLAGNPLCSD